MRIKQSEVFYKVSVTEICVFLTRRGTVTDFWLFVGLKKYFKKKSHHVSRLTLGYLWEEYEKFWFFIMCHIFSIWLGFSGHSLLRACAWETGADLELKVSWFCSKSVHKVAMCTYVICQSFSFNDLFPAKFWISAPQGSSKADFQCNFGNFSNSLFATYN